jgi:hypothetical protein
LIEQLIKKIDRTSLWIRISAPILYNGIQGVITWDSGMWNEITFVSKDRNIVHSLFTKLSDRETEVVEFDRLVNTYIQLANEGIYDSYVFFVLMNVQIVPFISSMITKQVLISFVSYLHLLHKLVLLDLL